MTRLLLTVAALAALAGPGPGLAQTAPAPAPKPTKVLKYLAPVDIDARRLLPPPPVDGSEINRAELAEMHRITDTASAERRTQAKWDDDHEDPSMFAATVGAGFDLDKLPATAEVLAIVQNDASIAASAAKKTFERRRPWAIDATIKTCDPDDKPLTSYPSGHSTLGYSLGMTLAVLIPEKSQAFLARAHDYAYSRVVCGSHYASDTQASQALAAAFVTALLKNPEFEVKLRAAHAELQAAKLAQ
jgi:acid phosphatase (class A)